MIIFPDDVAQEVREAKLIDLSGEPLPRQQYDTSRWVRVLFIITLLLYIYIHKIFKIDIIFISVEKMIIYHVIYYHILF